MADSRGMATTALGLDFLPRRAHARLRLRIPAQIMTVNGPRSITLLDLSQSGARVQLSSGERITGGVLSWIGFEAFGVRVWQSGQTVGLKFERPITSNWVLATRSWRPSSRDARIESRNFARDWARGTADNSAEPLFHRKLGSPSPKKPALDMQRLRRPKRGLWRRSGTVFILGSSLIGIAAGIASCFLG